MKLASEGRLFLPERVAREFIKHRDRKLADMLKAILDLKSQINIGKASISPLLEGLAEHDSLAKASEELSAAKKAYVTALEGLTAQIRSWRGNDPVTSLYADLFTGERMIGPNASQAELGAELLYRIQNEVPPGYKDSGKPDKGIGDFVIWKSLLCLGEREKKDLIFVTGEEKADWFVRMGGEATYPRPELVDEYRRASGGCTIRLSSLHDLLQEMAAPKTLVEEVKAAEDSANTAISHTSTAPSFVRFFSPDIVTFDYSTNNGQLTIQDRGKTFELAFSKASDTSIHLYRSHITRRIARIKKMAINLPVSIDVQETSSRTYTIRVGEGFLVENEEGDVLAGRIINIMDDTRGPDRDQVSFKYAVFSRGESIEMP